MKGWDNSQRGSIPRSNRSEPRINILALRVSDETADRMAQMKKQDMAEAAEQLLAATGQLPALMRTPRAAQGSTESPQPDAVTEAKDTEAYSVAAE
jgi:ParB family transcriptional regulator, chromosome partitioning protein